MKVNDKILSIPPYLSTSWRNVLSLHVRESFLVVTLRDGHSVSIPGLSGPDIDKIFKAHETYLEHETAPGISTKGTLSNLFTGLGDGSMQISFGGLDQLGGMFQHNPAQANSPPLPPEVLQKIATVAKMMAADDSIVLPKPEPNCHCFHCQVARGIQEAIYPQEEEITVEIEADISEEELQFSQWAIKPAGERLYTVINKLDTTEQYTVFLGDPVGCTCGKAGCEHVLAVLRS